MNQRDNLQGYGKSGVTVAVTPDSDYDFTARTVDLTGIVNHAYVRWWMHNSYAVNGTRKIWRNPPTLCIKNPMKFGLNI